MITSIKIFSFYFNCKKCFQDNICIENFNSLVNIIHFNNQSKYIIDKCSKIVGLIKSNNFSFFDFKMYVIYCFLMTNKLNWKYIDIQEIPKVSKLFLSSQIKKDKETILKLNEKLNFKNICDFYSVNSNGNNIMLDLTLKGIISPFTYITLFNKGIKHMEESKYELSEQLIKFNSITKKINSINSI